MRFSWWKPKDAPVPDPGFRLPGGLPYLDFLTALHNGLSPEWYLEIGTQKGRSLECARCRSIAIDPEFRIKTAVPGPLPELHLFQQTSDDFFASGFLRRNGIRLDLAFLDGMHLFEYLLRDFINAERHAAAGAVFAVHDCVPWCVNMAERDRNLTEGRPWTGDVWKLLPILGAFRPDLTVVVADCTPTGLVLVTGLDSASSALADAYEAIVAEMTPVTLAGYGAERLSAEYPFVDAGALAAAVRAEGRAALGVK
jgi:hypothetical protein